MVSLCVDKGNSRTKVVIYDGDQLRWKYSYRDFGFIQLEEVCDRFQPQQGILSSVVRCNELTDMLQQMVPNMLIFNADTPIPLHNAYKTPQTLGRDRIAAAVGASQLSPAKNLLIIDAGSAITYDIVTADGTFLGGNIAPGKRLRFTSLHDYTNQLPMVQYNEQTTIPQWGQNTEEAILAGVCNGILHEMQGYIQCLHTKYANSCVYITGGDARIFAPMLGDEVIYEEHLVPFGLKKILDYRNVCS